MQPNQRYYDIFGRIPILGMIHLTGDNPVRRALEEIAIFEEEGIDGVVVENYHGSVDDVVSTLQETSKRKPNVVVGVNILPNEFHRAFSLAHKYNADFIQLDHVAGNYVEGRLDSVFYDMARNQSPEVIVLGGVWPKYYHPIQGSDLEKDLKTGMKRAEAIVVTGAGTGQETPLYKIKKFRKVAGEHPLVVGAGLTLDNAYEQLCLSDGAIVGTSLKVNNVTSNPIDRYKVRYFMSVVKEVREYQRDAVQ